MNDSSLDFILWVTPINDTSHCRTFKANRLLCKSNNAHIDLHDFEDWNMRMRHITAHCGENAAKFVACLSGRVLGLGDSLTFTNNGFIINAPPLWWPVIEKAVLSCFLDAYCWPILDVRIGEPPKNESTKMATIY